MCSVLTIAKHVGYCITTDKKVFSYVVYVIYRLSIRTTMDDLDVRADCVYNINQRSASTHHIAFSHI